MGESFLSLKSFAEYPYCISKFISLLLALFVDTKNDSINCFFSIETFLLDYFEKSILYSLYV